MKKIKDGTYKGKHMAATGWVYGFLRERGDMYFIKEKASDSMMSPVHKDTLQYRFEGKWIKVF